MLLSSIFVYGGESMNLGEMIAQVNIDIDDSVNTADIKNWINRAIDDISPIAKKSERKVTDIISTNTYTLPSDCREIQHVVIDDEFYDHLTFSDQSSRGYKVWGSELVIQGGPSSGQVNLSYYRNLNKLVDDTDEPEIEPEYHDLFILYAVAMSQYMDDELPRQNDAMSRYAARKEDYKRFKAGRQAPHAIREVY